MDFGDLLLLGILPGLILMIVVVAVALPRALRDEKPPAKHRCPQCGRDTGGAPGYCSRCRPRLPSN